MAEGQRALVHLVLLSHSAALAAAAAALTTEVAGDRVTVHAVGGTSDGRTGTSSDLLDAAVRRSGEAGADVLVIPDLGSAVLTARVYLEDWAGPTDVVIADAPFVEGAVAAAVTSSTGAGLLEVRAAAEEARQIRKL